MTVSILTDSISTQDGLPFLPLVTPRSAAGFGGFGEDCLRERSDRVPQPPKTASIAGQFQRTPLKPSPSGRLLWGTFLGETRKVPRRQAKPTDLRRKSLALRRNQQTYEEQPSLAAGGRSLRKDQAVPPTVNPSIRNVGCPTPTGTLCPSLPQVPTPVSRAMSWPTIFTRVSASGPLPMRVAPFTG